MDVAQITMPRQRARQEFLKYKDVVDKRGRNPDARDREIMESYRQLSRGRTLIELYRVIREGGCDWEGRPRLAVARADAAYCRFDYLYGHHQRFTSLDDMRVPFSNRCNALRRITVPFRWDRPQKWSDLRDLRAECQVPLIPPKLRPRKDALRDHVILWEAKWDKPPVDPLLLRPVPHTRSLYVVVAAWDLTPLEQAVLGADNPSGH